MRELPACARNTAAVVLEKGVGVSPQDAKATLGIDEQKPTDDPFSQFRFDTWSAWRAGQLASLSPSFAEQAVCSYETFVREHALAPAFFAAHPPRPGELLISSVTAKGEDNPGLVLTNQRLWLYSKQSREYSELNVAEIASFKSSNGLTSASATISFKDRTQRKCTGIPFKPNDKFITNSLALCNRSQAFAPSPPPTQAQIIAIRQAEESRKERETKARGSFFIYGLVGVTLGSIVGAFVLDGKLIGDCAFFGGLLGYIAWQLQWLARRN